VSPVTRAQQVVVAASVMLAMASCTSAGNDPSTTTRSPTATDVPLGPTTTVFAATDSTVAVTTTTVTTSISYDIHIETSPDGEVIVTGPEVIEVNLGSSVDLTISSSIDDVLHIHGYDLFFDLTAGEDTSIEFVADVPGIFEVELEGGHVPVFDLEVTP
jgi:hypothetical protein